ncbi:MAG: ATP-binding protein [Candidatus Eisenbacteria bacterium]
MTPHTHIRALPLAAMLLLTLAIVAAAAEGGRLPFQLEVVNSHSWGEGTSGWVADMNGDGLDEVVGGNEELGQICPIRLVDGTYLEAGQLNLPINDESWHEVIYLGPQNVDDDPADEFLLSAVVNDTLWLFCYEVGKRLEHRFPIISGESRNREPWWDGKVRRVCRVELGDGGHGFAVTVGADMDLLPRAVLLFDSTFETALWRHDGGAQFRSLEAADVDGDGRDEIVFGTSAPSNGADANGTNDGESYVGVLDDDGTLLWLEPMGGGSTDTHIAVADLTGDGRSEVVSGTTPDLDTEGAASIVAVWDGASGGSLGRVRVPQRVDGLFPGRARNGNARVFFGNRGFSLLALGLEDGAAALVASVEFEARTRAQGCVTVDGVGGDCVLAGMEDGRLAVCDASLRLLAEHRPLRPPLFPLSEFLGQYREADGRVWLCGISDRVYLFDLVRSPIDWGLVWLIAAVAAGSAFVTAISVSGTLRGRLAGAGLAALAPLMPWAAAERARARLELVTALETGSHDKTIVTRPVRHLVDVVTMARGAGKGPDQIAAMAARWIEAHGETSRPALGRILDLAAGWGGGGERTVALREAAASVEDGLAKLEAALDRDPAPELSGFAMRVDALEDALRGLRTVAGEAYVTEVAPALRDALELRREELASVGVDVTVDVADVEGELAWVAPGDFQFIVSNLISNAVRAMTGADAPGPEAASLTQEERGLTRSRAAGRRIVIEGSSYGGFVELRFADTGCGIPESAWERIFELGETTKGESGGTGLHRSREDVGRLGGTLTIAASAPDAGTTVVLRLRAA